MNPNLATCIGGHLRQGAASCEFWRNAANAFFGAMGQRLDRVANSRGTIVPSTAQGIRAMYSRDTWELFGPPLANDALPEYYRWSTAITLAFTRGWIFLGADWRCDNAQERVVAFFEDEVLKKQSLLRYAYLFERDREDGPHSYVSGVHTWVYRRIKFNPQDELMTWWGNRLAFGQASEVVRDVFKRNYFLRSSENEFLERLLLIAPSFGEIRDVGDYVVWEVDASEREKARESLIQSGLIAAPHD